MSQVCGRISRAVRYLAASLFPLAFLLSAVQAQYDRETDDPFVVVVNNAPPFRIIESWNGRKGFTGVYIDTIREISRRTGLPLEYRHVPFARALRMMETGEADMMLGARWTVERAEYMVYLQAAFPAEPKVFYLAPSAPDITRYSDLDGLTIGVLRGARYFEPFDTDDALMKVPFNSYDRAFQLLQRNRIDALLIPERQGRFMLHSYAYDFRTSTFRVPGLPSFITLSIGSRLFKHRERIEQAMSDLKTKGYFEELMLLYLE